MLTDRTRWIGVVAGLGPTAVLGVFWLWTGVDVALTAAIASMGFAAVIAMTAGWMAGPLAVAEPRSLGSATIGYAIALIATIASASILQAMADVVAAGGVTPGAIAGAIAGRALVAVAAVAYLIVPALVAGVVWVLVARLVLRARGVRWSAAR
jgi:hypothetical protein